MAFFADRPDKDREVSVEELRSGWARQAASMGIDTSELVQVVVRAPPSDPGERISGHAVAEGLDRLTTTRTHLATRDLVTAVADAAQHGLDGREVVRVAGALEAAVGTGRRHDGRHPGLTVSDAVDRALGADPTLVERALAGRPTRPVSREGPSVEALRRSGRAVGDGLAARAGPSTGLGR